MVSNLKKSSDTDLGIVRERTKEKQFKSRLDYLEKKKSEKMT